jgi:DNA-binding MarR family transcriptional regulator
MPDRATNASQQWRKERPDLDPFPMEVLGRLLEAATTLSRDRINPVFVDAGLQPGEFDVLATLRRSGAPYALTPTALYETLMISSGGMTNRIDRLESAALVQRKVHPSDRRGTLVALTPAGKTLIDDVLERHIANERDILSTLSSDDQHHLNRLLATLLAGHAPRTA